MPVYRRASWVAGGWAFIDETCRPLPNRALQIRISVPARERRYAARFRSGPARTITTSFAFHRSHRPSGREEPALLEPPWGCPALIPARVGDGDTDVLAFLLTAAVIGSERL